MRPDTREDAHLAARLLRRVGLAAVLLHFLPAAAGAQHQHLIAADSSPALNVQAMGIALITRGQPGPLNEPLTEGYVTQPMLSARLLLANGLFELRTIINAEGATLRRGEFNPGVYGEGYVDRRHPHTWLHEAMVGTRFNAGDFAISVFGGKGFVPFGSADPMFRPFVKYPANHHHAQILERAQIVLGARYRYVNLEGAVFNGDEPESPSDMPNAKRLFDSHSIRATVDVTPAVSLSGSLANVQSPEFSTGEGLDQRKASATLHFSRSAGSLRYALLEFAETRELRSGREMFRYTSLLGEAQWKFGPALVAARAERTERPEEERTASLYRTVRPLLDFHILGRTRWTNFALSLASEEKATSWLWYRPFVEVAYHTPRAIAHPAPLDPEVLFGTSNIWMFSAGVRLGAGQTWQLRGR